MNCAHNITSIGLHLNYTTELVRDKQWAESLNKEIKGRGDNSYENKW